MRGQKVWKRSKWKLGMGVLEQKPRGLFQALCAAAPTFWAPGTGFLEDAFPMDQCCRAGAGLGMILIRSEQSTSLSYTGHSRAHASTRV